MTAPRPLRTSGPTRRRLRRRLHNWRRAARESALRRAIARWLVVCALVGIAVIEALCGKVVW